MNTMAKKLLFACRKGKLAWLDTALDGGASAELRDEDGQSALAIAASLGHAEICMKLLETGARAKDEAVAAARAGGHEALAEQLDAWSPPAVAGFDAMDREWALIKAAKKGNMTELRALLEGGVDPNTPTQIQLPLTAAAAAGNLEMMELLRAHGSQLQVARIEPPLVAAARGGRLEAVERLLEWGAEVDASDDSQATALARAAVGGHVEIARRLLEAGADTAAVSNARNPAIVRLLADHDAKAAPVPSFEAARLEICYATPEQVEHWLAREPGLAKARDEYGYTLLHDAVHEPVAPVIVDLLVNAGADVRARTDQGIEPIHLARAPLVGCLIELGADVNARDNGESTPLMIWAAEREGLAPMRALLASGADPSLTRSDGSTARSIAARREESRKLALLDEHDRR